MQRLANKHILLGITGSIAVYKAADLVRRIREQGAEVRVVMTHSATEFVTPMTFQALSGHPVYQHLLDTEAEAGMGHIELARWADIILIAPASANFISKLVQGRADDLLGAICLASTVPLALAPAMNKGMWNNPATQENIRVLQSRGVAMFGPGSGSQACGDIGVGRLQDVDDIMLALSELFLRGFLTGKTVLITAGPTQEAIDPVRFISNHSSGKMGFSLAQAAIEAGARVILVSGPVALKTPSRVTRYDVISAQDMFESVLAHLAGVDIFIATAAVADYRPVHVATDKIKKNGGTMQLTLEPTVDILAEVKARFPRLFCLGFAAETRNLNHFAQEKMQRKGIDMIAANWVGSAANETDGTFGSDTNAVRLFWHDGDAELTVTTKTKLARQIIEHTAQCYDAREVRIEQYDGKVVPLPDIFKRPRELK